MVAANTGILTAVPFAVVASARSMKLAQTCCPDMWHDPRMDDAQMQYMRDNVYAEYR